jgi:surfeit locus 1 family protein
VIQGKINLPGKAFGLGAMTLENTWPRRLQFVEYSAINALLASEGVDDGVLPFVLMLDANEPDGLQRDWKPLPQGPEKHYAYMVQWFAMALTVCVIYFVLSIKTRENDGEVHDK